MKILILMNNAEDYPLFFGSLGEYLEKNGNTVFYAYDSHLPQYCYPTIKTNLKSTFVFSDYFKESSSGIKDLRPHFKALNIWQMFFADFDRFDVFKLHKNKSPIYFQNLLVALLHFFDDIFLKNAIDVVIFENVSNTLAYSAHEVAKIYGKKFLGIASSRLPSRFEIHDEILDISKRIEKDFQKLANDSNKNPISTYVSDYLSSFHEVIPDYMKNNPTAYDRTLRSQYLNTKKISYLLNIIKYTVTHSKELFFVYQTGNPITFSLKMMGRNLKRKFHLKFMDKLFDRSDSSEKYYLYPLHFHPESSTSVLAPEYNDEITTITNIAFSLPFGHLLYVKDHRSAAGYPDPLFYSKLKKIPNVRLIHYNENIKNLIKASQGVITLTSTAGYEALLLGKPVYVFGRVFYEFHPNCFKVDRPRDLFNLLCHAPTLIKDRHNLNELFVEAYYLNTKAGFLNFSQKEMYPPIFEAISTHLTQMNLGDE